MYLALKISPAMVIEEPVYALRRDEDFVHQDEECIVVLRLVFSKFLRYSPSGTKSLLSRRVHRSHQPGSTRHI